MLGTRLGKHAGVVKMAKKYNNNAKNVIGSSDLVCILS